MISKIVKKYRKESNLTQSEFGEKLCVKLRGVSLSKQAISNWERGAQTPDYMFMIAVLMAYGDWRHDFALECLQSLRPQNWGDPVTE